jgi:negative regulator of sigma E activity
MKQVIDEQLSAFLDGELPAAEEQLLLRRLERETGYQEQLVRYAVIGQLIRGESAISGGAGLASRISEAVAVEETYQDQPGRTASAWGSLATAGAAAAGLFVLAGLVSLGVGPVGDTQPVTAATPSPQIRTADFQSPADAPIEPARLTAYLVAHGDYAGGLSRPVVSSHVVNGTPDFIRASARGGMIDE